jgi:hypothetical protein
MQLSGEWGQRQLENSPVVLGRSLFDYPEPAQSAQPAVDRCGGCDFARQQFRDCDWPPDGLGNAYFPHQILILQSFQERQMPPAEVARVLECNKCTGRRVICRLPGHRGCRMKSEKKLMINMIYYFDNLKESISGDS